MEEYNMTLNKYLDIAPEVQKALDEGRPVVALESTIISHGMPYPQNVETALNVEKIIRENGAVPATIAVIGGRLKAGLSEAEIDYLGKTGAAVTKASRRDLPILVAEGRDGATTVTTAALSRPSTSPPIWRSWPTPPSWWSAPVPSPFWIWA